MKATRRNAMIVPNSHQSQQGAMDHQMRAQNAVPVLHRATRSNRLTPTLKEQASDGTTGWSKSLHQRFHIRSKDVSTLPRPSHHVNGLPSQQVEGLVLFVLQVMSKTQQGGQCQLQQACDPLHVVLQTHGNVRQDFKQQVDQGFQFLLPARDGHQSCRRLPLRKHHIQQAMQFSEQIGDGLPFRAWLLWRLVCNTPGLSDVKGML